MSEMFLVVNTVRNTAAPMNSISAYKLAVTPWRPMFSVFVVANEVVVLSVPGLDAVVFT